MYQVRTFGNLCQSRKLLEKREDILDYIHKVVKQTNKYRKENPINCLINKWKEKVTKKDVEEGIEIINIRDPLVVRLFLPEKPISDPCIPPKNAKYIKDHQ